MANPVLFQGLHNDPTGTVIGQVEIASTSSLDPGTKPVNPGMNAMIIFNCFLQVDDKEAHRVKRWAIEALVHAARRKPLCDDQ